MKIHNLSRSIFQKDHFYTFVGLIIGLLSIPILLTAVYEPQRLGSFAMVSDEGGGSFVTTVKVTTPIRNDISKPNVNKEKEENKDTNKPDNECDIDRECGDEYICRFRGGTRRCIQKPVATVSTAKPTAIVTTTAGGGGRPKQGYSLDFAALLSCTNNVKREGKMDFFKIDWECYYNKTTPKEKE